MTYTGETIRLHEDYTEDYTEDYQIEAYETHYHITLLDGDALRYFFRSVAPRLVVVLTSGVLFLWVLLMIDMIKGRL